MEDCQRLVVAREKSEICEKNKIMFGRGEEEQASLWLTRRGCQILHRNKKILGIEVDIVCRAPNSELWLIEVKSSGSNLRHQFLHPVSSRQRRRLQKVVAVLGEAQPTRAHLMLVGREVLFFSDFLSQ